MSIHMSNIVRYDGRLMAVSMRPLVQIEAYRGRRWHWCGQRGWWVHLYLLHGWHTKKFVRTLSEAGVFLKHDIDMLPWLVGEGQSSEAQKGEGGLSVMDVLG